MSHCLHLKYIHDLLAWVKLWIHLQLTSSITSRNELYISIRDISRKIDDIPWLKFINNILSPITRVNANEKVYVSDIRFFKELAKLLDRTDSRVLANYALWPVVSGFIDTLNDKIRRRQNLYRNVTTKKSRAKICEESVAKLLARGYGALYVRRHLDADSTKIVENIVLKIRKTLIKSLKKVSHIHVRQLLILAFSILGECLAMRFLSFDY